MTENELELIREEFEGITDVFDRKIRVPNSNIVNRIYGFCVYGNFNFYDIDRLEKFITEKLGYRIVELKVSSFAHSIEVEVIR